MLAIRYAPAATVRGLQSAELARNGKSGKNKHNRVYLCVAVFNYSISNLFVAGGRNRTRPSPKTLSQCYQMGHRLLYPIMLHSAIKLDKEEIDYLRPKFDAEIPWVQSLANRLNLEVDIDTLNLSRPSDQSPIFSESVSRISEQIKMLHGVEAQIAFDTGLLIAYLHWGSDPERDPSDWYVYHFSKSFIPDLENNLKALGIKENFGNYSYPREAAEKIRNLEETIVKKISSK